MEEKTVKSLQALIWKKYFGNQQTDEKQMV